jgi:hypothetical protein
MTTLSVINILPSNKKEIQTFVQDAKNRILAGYENPLKIAVQLKSFEEVIKELRDDKDIKELILKEAEKEGKSFKQFNAEFNIKEVGVKYDYSVCDDQQWNELDKQITGLIEKRTAREKFLKVIKGEVYDANGIHLNPPAKKSTTSVTVTLL